MSSKRSIRFEDEIEEKILKEEGKNFTDKLHNVLRDYYSPRKKQEIEALDVKINQRKLKLKDINKTIDKISKTLEGLKSILRDEYFKYM